MTTTESQPQAHPHAHGAPGGQSASGPAYARSGGSARGVQSVKFSFYRVADHVRREIGRAHV